MRSPHLGERRREAGLQRCIVVRLCVQLCKAALVQDKHASRLTPGGDISGAHEERVAFLVEQCEVGRWLPLTQGRHQEGFVLHIVLCLIKGEARDLRSKLRTCPAYTHES